jgi:hypothetical protein
MKTLVLVALLGGTAWADASPVAYGDGGIKVGDTVVYTQKVTRAALDATLDLVWFTAGGKLLVLDLREPSPKPHVIATGVKNEYAFSVSGASNADSSAQSEHSYVKLVIGKKTKIEVGAPNWSPPEADTGNAPYAAAVKKTKLVGKKWLAGLAKRKANPTPDATAHTFTIQPSTIENGVQLCELVTANGKHTALVPSFKVPCSGAAIDPTADRYYANDSLCTPGVPPVCKQDAGWFYVGWSVK